jgi:hypothetical protein
MVVLIKGERSAQSTHLVSMGNPVLSHNNISSHSSFLRRLENASNRTRAVARGADTLAAFIRGKLILAGQYNQTSSRNLVGQMVNHIIYLREQNQIGYMPHHIKTMGQHQQLKNSLNQAYKEVRNNIARRDPEFQELLNRLRNSPNNGSLIKMRNNRLNQNQRIRSIKRQQQKLRSNIINLTTKTSEHGRQLAAWKWVKAHVVHRV